MSGYEFPRGGTNWSKDQFTWVENISTWVKEMCSPLEAVWLNLMNVWRKMKEKGEKLVGKKMERSGEFSEFWDQSEAELLHKNTLLARYS